MAPQSFDAFDNTIHHAIVLNHQLALPLLLLTVEVQLEPVHSLAIMSVITLDPIVIQLPLGSLPEVGPLFTAPWSILNYDQTTGDTCRTNGHCDYQCPPVAHSQSIRSPGYL